MEREAISDSSRCHAARGRICQVRDCREQIGQKVVMTEGRNELDRCIFHTRHEIAPLFFIHIFHFFRVSHSGGWVASEPLPDLGPA